MRTLLPATGPPALPPPGVRTLEGRHPFAAFARDQSKRLQPDLVHERYSLPGTIAGLGGVWLMEVNAPLVWEQALFRGGSISPRALADEARALRAPDTVIAVSEPLADWIPRDDVWVVPNGVAAIPAATPRSRSGPFVLGFEGTFKPWHGLEAEVATLPSLADVVARPVHVELAGDGPLRAEVLAALAALTARDPCVTYEALGALDAAQLADARTRWHAAWSPQAPWPPNADDLVSRAGAPVPPRWFGPLKEAEAAAAGLPLWKGGVLVPPSPPPLTWPETARSLLRRTGVVPAAVGSWDDTPPT